MKKSIRVFTLVICVALFSIGLSAQVVRGEKVGADQDWALIDQFGKNRTFIQKSTIKFDGPLVRAKVRYSLKPSGVDKRNGKAIAEIIHLEEYNLPKREFRIYWITLVYEGGGTSDFSTQIEWRPATAGNEKTLNFLRLFEVSSDRENIIGGIFYPLMLGGFELRSVIDNEKSYPGLGVTLLYGRSEVKISIFIYNKLKNSIPEGVESVDFDGEFAEATNDILRAYADARILMKERLVPISNITFLESIFLYSEMGSASRAPVISHLYVTARNNHFVKVRATYSATDRPELGHRVHLHFVEELGKLLANQRLTVN
jgi:hypothetical protein